MTPEAPTSSAPEVVAPTLDVTSAAYIGTMTHFYRGELGRMMVWRQRFDATVNWSIIATGSLVAYAVGKPAMMNQAMLINLAVLGFFAFLEARRYRFYDTFRARVRMLEVHFIAPAVLGAEKKTLQGPWREHLVQDLIIPSFKCSYAFALGRRFRHIYGALHLFVLFAWVFLVGFHTRTFSEWAAGFSLGKAPGWLVLTLVLIYLLVLAIIIFRSGALGAKSGEVRRYRREVKWGSLVSDAE